MPSKEEIHGIIKFLIFSNIMLTLTKCLALCMFELTAAYYIYVMLIILPLRCFPFKSPLRSSKL